MNRALSYQLSAIRCRPADDGGLLRVYGGCEIESRIAPSWSLLAQNPKGKPS